MIRVVLLILIAPRFNIAEISREIGQLGQQTLHFANKSGNKIRSHEVSNYNSIEIQIWLNCSVNTV